MNNDPCGCNAVLVDGVYQSKVKRGDKTAEADVFTYVANLTYEEHKRLVETGGGVDFLGWFGANGDFSVEQWNAKTTQMKSEGRYKGSTVEHSELVERYGDEKILKAWMDCKRNCTSAPLRSWIVQYDSKRSVLKYFWTRTGNAKAIVTGSTITGGIVTDSGVPAGTVILNGSLKAGTEESIHIERADPLTPITISVQISGDVSDIAEYIPKATDTGDDKTIQIEIASEGQSSAPGRLLFPDAFSSRLVGVYGDAVTRVEFYSSRPMPANGQHGYFGYLWPLVDGNQVLLYGALYNGISPFKADLKVWHKSKI